MAAPNGTYATRENGRTPPAILALGTAVPAYQVAQADVGRWMAASLADRPGLARWIERLYASSGIATRHVCVPDILGPPGATRLAPGVAPDEALTTAERMAIYAREATALGTAASQRALAELAESTDTDIATVTASVTHLVAVSCTGFFAPGLDLMVARRLGLAPDVERTLIGFMGCAAAFNGLRLAHHIVRGDPDARVLVVCVELCSLHLQPGAEPVQLVVASLFADGAAACLVGAPVSDADRFDIAGTYTRVTPDTLDDMVWQIGNHGFVLSVSPDIPTHLGQAAPAAVRTLAGDPAELGFWALHPGGRGIVDTLGQVFGLTAEQLAPSRAVLRDYGNLSSPTILFVLAEVRRALRQGQPSGPVPGVAMGFGPGLVTEMAHLVYEPAAVEWPAAANGYVGRAVTPT